MVNKNYVVVLVLSCCITLLFNSSVNAYDFPPYEGLKLKITGNISENYSNNTTFAKDNKNKVEDFRTMAALGMDLKYEGKRRSLGFSGAANRRIEYDDSDISNSSEKAAVIFRNDFSEYDRIRISNTFTHSQEPDSFDRSDLEACQRIYRNNGYSPAEIDTECNQFEEEFGRFRGRYDSYSNAVSFGYNKAIGEHLNINTNYDYVENWSPEENALDSHQNALRAGLKYMYGPATAFSLLYSYRISEYENGNDRSQQSVSAGMKQYITRRIYFDGSIGQNFVSEGSDSISGRASLYAEMDEQTNGSLSFSRGVQISPNEEDTFRNWRISGSLTRHLLEDFRGSLTAFYGEGDFVSADVTDTLMGVSALLSYSFWTGKRGSSVNGRVGYTYSDLDSTNENRGYQRSSVTASLTLAF